MAKGSGSIRVQYPHNRKQKSSVRHAIAYNARIAIAACNRLRKIINDRATMGRSKDGSLFKFGEITDELCKVYKRMTGEEIKGKDMYTGQKVLFHHRTEVKADKDKLANLSDIAQMPMTIQNMDVYIYKKDIAFSDNINKYVLKPNVTIKAQNGEEKIINHVSSSRLKDASVFTRANGYRKITL